MLASELRTRLPSQQPPSRGPLPCAGLQGAGPARCCAGGRRKEETGAGTCPCVAFQAAMAGTSSELSDSEILQLLEEPARDSPQPGDSGQPNSSSDLPLDSLSTEVAADTAAGQVKRKRAQTPLEKYSLKYLSVTDLSTQSWCEQQMVYGRELPQLQAPEKVRLLNTGKSIHLARELEVHDIVEVRTTSKEDSWALKILNLLSMIPVLQAGGCVREVPVFGVIDGIFLVGIIDELCYTAKGELELRELKTRGRPSMPSEAQKKRDYFQVCLYKYIFDAMIQGQLKPDVITRHIRLRPEQPLGSQIRQHAQKVGFVVTCFGDLLELMYLNLTLSDLPSIDRLTIEYSHQDSDTPLGTEVVEFEEEKVRERVQCYLAYWKGQREVQGVEIEEAWKCRSCSYSEICDWRRTRADGPEQRSGSKKSK